MKLYQGQELYRPLYCPLCDGLGKLRKVGRYQLLSHNFQTTTAIIFHMETALDRNIQIGQTEMLPSREIFTAQKTMK